MLSNIKNVNFNKFSFNFCSKLIKLTKGMKLIDGLNKHLRNSNQKDFINTLKNASEEFFPPIDHEYAASLYFLEFKTIYDDKETNLDLEDFINGIKVLNSIALINRAIEFKFSSNNEEINNNNNNNEDLFECLSEPNAHLQDINKNLINLYKNLFFKLKSEKLMINDENNNTSSSLSGANNFLIHSEIQDCITNGNIMFEKEYLGKLY
jgi:hypothetical protein